MRLEAMVDGLYGIALQHNHGQPARKVAGLLLDKLGDKAGAKHRESLSFQQKLEVMWSACALGLEDKKIVKALYQDLNNQNFERTDHDLSYE